MVERGGAVVEAVRQRAVAINPGEFGTAQSAGFVFTPLFTPAGPGEAGATWPQLVMVFRIFMVNSDYFSISRSSPKIIAVAPQMWCPAMSK